jgi:hypothetical protein
MSKKYKKLIEQILTLHDLHQSWSPSHIANELQNSDCPPPQTRRALVRFINYTIKRGTVNARWRSGRPRTTRTRKFISLVKQNIENKRKQSMRRTNRLIKKEQLKSSYGSVHRALRYDIKIKPWKITRSQKINDTQRHERVRSAKILLRKFGNKPTRSNSKWKRLINSDFSGRINLIQKHNAKNNVIWSKNKTTIPPELLTVGQQKYSPGVMIFGSISSRGLIPNNSPIFIDEWLKTECKRLKKKRITMDRFMYIKLIETELKPHIDTLYPDVNVIWQDDMDSKHRSSYALNKIDELFCERITHDEEASKMADIWPIENIWGYIKEKIDEHEVENITALKYKIIQIWNTIKPDMCSKLINSIPKRLQCVINKKGHLINRKDYNSINI